MSLLDDRKEVESGQLVYNTAVLTHPVYRYNKLLPMSGTQNFTVSAAANNDLQFEIPTKCFNLAQSFISFTVAPNAATGLAGAGWQYPIDCVSWFYQLQLSTRSGVYLCDLQNVDRYTSIVRRKETKRGELYGLGPENLLCPGDSQTGQYFANATQVTDATRRIGTGAYNAATLAFAGAPPAQLTEPATCVAGVADPNFNTDILRIQIPLSAFKNTILALDKDLYFPEVLVLRVVLNTAVRAVWGAAVADPNAGGAIANQRAGTQMNITNMAMYLAVNSDAELCGYLVEMVNSGKFHFLIPYVYTVKNSISTTAGANVAITQKLNRGYGISLLKVIHSAFAELESKAPSQDAANNNGSKIASIFTSLDGNRLQDQNVNCTTLAGAALSEDYMHMRKFLADSAVGGGAYAYQYKWFWCDDFSGDVPDAPEASFKDNLIRGISLDSERRWDAQMTGGANIAAATAFNFYTHFITQKRVQIGSSGITVL